MPGMGELLIILAIVMLIFGAGKLPQIGDALGRSIKNFKRSVGGNDEIEVNKKSELSAKQARELEAGDDDYAEVVSKNKKAKSAARPADE
jgi:sec-independent protein translocase protein TatA